MGVMGPQRETTIDEVRVIRRAEVLRLTGLTKSSLYRLIEGGEFVRPVRLGPNSVGWRLGAVLEWIRALPEVDATREATVAPPRSKGIDQSTRNAQGRTRRGQ